MAEEKEKSLFKILFGGKYENMLIITFGVSLLIFAVLGLMISSETIEATSLVKNILIASGLVMIAVLVILPFLSFRHMMGKE